MKIITVALIGLMSLGQIADAGPEAQNGAVALKVHVTLRDSASVQPDSGGYFTLSQVAELSGGDAGRLGRLAAVKIGRAPLPQTTRHITLGDIALKIRQAGMDPDLDTVLEGAALANVVTLATNTSGGQSPTTSPDGQQTPVPVSNAVIIHRGDMVTIILQDEDMVVSARGVSRDDGAIGETIHVHRDGAISELTVTVIDPHTVQLEI